ncbi:MAG: hypothetical protein P0Y64_16825 [Candidatus Sphingomonas colombiensis]|nr:hypothetical protein [Sphingomonas sp.]WEK42984.1 MAG: hypothetical protein P0Y64_16825 [Sphingomonas sp.]
MMGIPPSEFKRLSWWEYQALVATWSARHDPEGTASPAEAPDADFVAKRQARLAKRGLVRTVH